MNHNLIKPLPLLIVVLVLGYAGYSIHPADPGALPTQPGPAARGVSTSTEGVRQAGTENLTPDAPGERPRRNRDPFRTRAQIAAESKPKETHTLAKKKALPPLKSPIKDEGEGKPPPPLDPHAGEVEALTLNATFLQGRDGLAVIDGKIYRVGQALEGSDKAASTLRVAEVGPTRVIFQAGDRRYELGYPDLGRAAPARAVVGPSPAQTPFPGPSLDTLDPMSQAEIARLLGGASLGSLARRMLGLTAVERMPGQPRSALGEPTTTRPIERNSRKPDEREPWPTSPMPLTSPR